MTNQQSKRVCYQRNPKMCWNWMKFGRLSSSKLQNTGYGQLFVDELVKLWHLSSAIIVHKHADHYGTRFPKNIGSVTPSVIFGMRIKKSFQKKRIAVLAKTVDRRIIWNVGIAPCDK